MLSLLETGSLVQLYVDTPVVTSMTGADGLHVRVLAQLANVSSGGVDGIQNTGAGGNGHGFIVDGEGGGHCE